jgi:hypothetical protein
MAVGWAGVLVLLFVSSFGVVVLLGIGERRAALGMCLPGVVLGLAGSALLIWLGTW